MPPLPDSDMEDGGDGLDDMEEIIVNDDPIDDNDDELADGVDDIDFSDDEGVIEVIDESKFVFEKHAASVFSIDVCKNSSPLVVTGGEDDKGFVWNYNNGNVLFECTGHKDSVVCCGFSSDSKYVMTADMGGTVIVFSTSDHRKVCDFDCSDLEWCMWHKSAHVLFAGTSSGDVYMWKIPGGDCKIYTTHGCRATSGDIMPNGKEIIVGYGDGSLKKWDLKTVTCIFHYKSEDTADPILCLDILSLGQKNGNLIAGGTENGRVRLLNSHNGKQVSSFEISTNPLDATDMEGEEGGESTPCNTIECVSFSPCGLYIAGSSLNGMLCIWDISTQRMRHECTNPSGITKLIWNNVEPNYIVTSCLDGTIRMWDPKNGELFKELQGHLGNILDIALSMDGKYILTAGDDSTSRIFEK